MPVLKVKKNGIWEEIGGTSPADGGNANTLDGKLASYFAAASDVADLQSKIGDTPVSEQIKMAIENIPSGKTLTDHFAEETMVLTFLQYGDELPGEDGKEYTHVAGRLFFKKVST